MSTPAQRAAAARRRSLMIPQRATIDPSVFGGSDKTKTAAPGASGMQMPPEGRTHFFLRGRGPTIDFGPILRPRSTGISPTEGNAYEPTTGVGGFFRRLLGDNADELNAAWANQRLMRQMGQEDMAAAQAFEMEKLAAQQANAMQLAEAQRQGQMAAAEAQRQGLMGVERYRAQNELDRQGAADTQALIRQAAELQARGQMAGAENVSRENVARINAEGDVTRSLLGGGGGSERSPIVTLPGGGFINMDTQTIHQPDLMNPAGGFKTYPLNGVPGAPAATSVGITDAQRQSAREKMAALKQQQELDSKPILEMGPPSPAQQFDTAMSGLAYADRPALEQAFAQSALQRAEFAPTQIGGSRLYRDPASALESRTPAIMEQFQALPTETQMDIYRSALSGIEGLSPEALRGKSKKAQIKPLFQLPFTLR